MNRRLLLVGGISLFLSSAAFSQQTSIQHQLPQAIENHVKLAPQVSKINEKQVQLSNANTSSRAVYAQLKEELVSLLEAYNGMLKQEFTKATSDDVKKAINAEIKFVTDQLSQLNNTTQR